MPMDARAREADRPLPSRRSAAPRARARQDAHHAFLPVLDGASEQAEGRRARRTCHGTQLPPGLVRRDQAHRELDQPVAHHRDHQRQRHRRLFLRLPHHDAEPAGGHGQGCALGDVLPDPREDGPAQVLRHPLLRPRRGRGGHAAQRRRHDVVVRHRRGQARAHVGADRDARSQERDRLLQSAAPDWRTDGRVSGRLCRDSRHDDPQADAGGRVQGRYVAVVAAVHGARARP
jgi:hypothetical protein